MSGLVNNLFHQVQQQLPVMLMEKPGAIRNIAFLQFVKDLPVQVSYHCGFSRQMFCEYLEHLAPSGDAMWPPGSCFWQTTGICSVLGDGSISEYRCQSYMVDFVRTKEQQWCFAVIQKQDVKRQLLLNGFILCKISQYRAVVNLALVSCLSLCGYSSCKSFHLAEKSFALVGGSASRLRRDKEQAGQKGGNFRHFHFPHYNA